MASVEKRANDWRVVWRQDGAKQYERFATEADAEKFRAKVEADGNRWPRGWIPGVGDDEAGRPSVAPTFRDWATRRINARSTANARTRHDYLRDLELHAFPTFGPMPVDRITTEDVGRWLIALTTPGPSGKAPSYKTVKNVHSLCSSVMSEAVDERLSPGNPFHKRMRALPKVKTEEMVFLTRQEFDTLLRHTPEPWRPLMMTLFMTGLRWSEATALRVCDVDVLARRLTVVQAWKRTPENWYEIGEPKSRRSRRTISFPPSLASALVPLVANREPGEFVFTTLTGRPVRHANFYNRVWLPVIAAMRADGVAKRPRIHDARHSHASWLVAAGVTMQKVQYRLGHESIVTTMDRYAHLMPDGDADIDAALDDSPALEPQPVD